MRLQKRSGCGGSQVVCHPFFSGRSGRGPQLRSCGPVGSCSSVGACISWRSHGGRSAEVRAGSCARSVPSAAPFVRRRCVAVAWRPCRGNSGRFVRSCGPVRSVQSAAPFVRRRCVAVACRRAAKVRAGSCARAVRRGSGRSVRVMQLVRFGSGPPPHRRSTAAAVLLRPALPAASRPTAPRRFSRRPSRRPLRRPSRCGAAACRA